MNASDVLNRLTRHKRSQVAFLDHVFKVDSKLATSLAGCGSWLVIREWELSGQSRVRNAFFCKRFLICPACGVRRASKLITPFTAKIEVAQDMHPGLIPVIITLTIKNRPDLGDGLQHLKDSRRRMMEAKRKGASVSGRHARIEWNKIVGAVSAIEVTRNKDTAEWHPHMHVFALVSEYIDREKLSAEWRNFTGGDSFIVDVRKCKNGIVSGLTEVLKYVSKPSELSPELLLELYHGAKGSRFVDSHGCLRGMPEICMESDDDEGLHGPFRDFMALWRGRGYSMESVGQRLEILRPGDAGYGAPREHIYEDPGPEQFPEQPGGPMASLPA